MYIDYHSHILPRMDDGAEDTAQSLEMIKSLKAQGVDRIISTSHFYAHRESVDNFLSRRERRLEELLGANPAITDIIPGAEVAIERDLSEKKELEKLTVGDSGFILLELPYRPYSGWMTEEILEIQFGLGLKPIIAHLNRYISTYSSSQINDILSLSGVLFQFNNEVFHSRRDTAFLLKLIKNDYPVVFGSDTHNMDKRAPNFDIFEKVMKKKLRGDKFDALIKDYCKYMR